LRTVVITGPESTGKTLISEYLALQLGCPWIPEFAREYIGSLDRPYVYEDLLYIADNQILQKRNFEKSGADIVILDTWLIITKVWFMEVFHKCPAYIDVEILSQKIDLYIICKPDIPWVPDALRENGGEKRDYLMGRYIEEIRKTGSDYVLIGGEGDLRYQSALQAVKMHFNTAV